jgi:hypothetical protein
MQHGVQSQCYTLWHQAAEWDRAKKMMNGKNDDLVLRVDAGGIVDYWTSPIDRRQPNKATAPKPQTFCVLCADLF